MSNRGNRLTIASAALAIVMLMCLHSVRVVLHTQPHIAAWQCRGS